MNPLPVNGAVEVPLTGCDAFFLALEDLMASGGQGRHTGLTVIEMDSGFDFEALQEAASRFSLSHPLLHAVLYKPWFPCAPYWKTPDTLSPSAVPVLLEAGVIDIPAFCRMLLHTNSPYALELRLIPNGHKSTLVAKWSHLLFDGRGAELAIQEIARLAANPSEPARPVASWGIPFPPPSGFLARWWGTRAFVKRHYEWKPSDFKSLGGPVPRNGPADFRVMTFSRDETKALLSRAAELTGGIFQMPYFFAAAARAHAAVFRSRSQSPASYVSPVPVQARKPKARHPIFQNQVSVLHFKLDSARIHDLRQSTAAIHAQFESAVRAGLESSTATMLWWMRNLPPALYRRFLQHDTGGEIVSFFQSHTGEFLPGVSEICGASILNGWHIPSVAQPPGSGIFFSERGHRLTMTISWRDGTLDENEVDIIESSLRADLLGERH